jgi:hypothetical protein
MWELFGLLVAVFVLYLFAHAWVIRPLIERAVPGFPFLDRILGGSRMSSEEEAFWERELARRRKENGL